MKISVYLKKSDSRISNICFRVREKNVDIKVVSPLTVYDKYWDADTLCYKCTTTVPATEQKRLPEQVAAIIERAEKTFSDKADSKWLKQVIEDVLYPARAFERNHPNLLYRIHEYLEKFDGAERTKETSYTSSARCHATTTTNVRYWATLISPSLWRPSRWNR